MAGVAHDLTGRDRYSIRQHRALRPVEVTLRHAPEQHDVAISRNVTDEPVLHHTGQEATAPNEHRPARLRVAALEVRRAEAEPAEQQ